MPAFTTNQWAILVLVLVAGWLLGLMSNSRGGRWRRDYERERDAHAALRRDYDDHLSKHRTVDDRREIVDRDRDGIDDRDEVKSRRGWFGRPVVDRDRDGVDDRVERRDDELPPVGTRKI